MSTTTIADEFVATTRMDVHELVRRLNAALGPTLVAAVAGSKDPKAPIRWAKHDGGTPRPEFESRLRTAHRALKLVADAEDVHVARAWFIAANPLLDETTPITAIREGHHREALRAAAALASDQPNA